MQQPPEPLPVAPPEQPHTPQPLSAQQIAQATTHAAAAAPAPAGSPTRRVVICGGGIIGCATAYYLAQLGLPPVLVEQEEVACAASGAYVCMHAYCMLAAQWE